MEIKKLTGDERLQQYWPLRLRALREYPAWFGGVDMNNAPAIRLYESLGFSATPMNVTP